MQLATNSGSTFGGECPTNPVVPLTFINGVAEGPWGKLGVSNSGEIEGWLKVPPPASNRLPFIVNISGRQTDAVVSGSVSGRCAGSFTMRKQ